jgi:hypothetical protein
MALRECNQRTTHTVFFVCFSVKADYSRARRRHWHCAVVVRQLAVPEGRSHTQKAKRFFFVLLGLVRRTNFTPHLFFFVLTRTKTMLVSILAPARAAAARPAGRRPTARAARLNGAVPAATKLKEPEVAEKIEVEGVFVCVSVFICAVRACSRPGGEGCGGRRPGRARACPAACAPPRWRAVAPRSPRSGRPAFPLPCAGPCPDPHRRQCAGWQLRPGHAAPAAPPVRWWPDTHTHTQSAGIARGGQCAPSPSHPALRADGGTPRRDVPRCARPGSVREQATGHAALWRAACRTLCVEPRGGALPAAHSGGAGVAHPSFLACPCSRTRTPPPSPFPLHARRA